MRRKPILLLCAGLLLPFLFPLNGKGQQGAPPFFNERIDFFQGAEGGLSIVPTDSGYLSISLSQYSTDRPDPACRVALLDSSGGLEALKTYYGDSSWFYPVFSRGALKEDTDGNFIYPATYSKGTEPQINLMKFTPAGDTLWTYHYGDTIESRKGMDVQFAQDGNGYILLGLNGKGGVGGFDIQLYRLDSNGSVLWTKTYGDQDYAFGANVDTTPDGGFVISGSSQAFFPIDSATHSFVLKLDSIGNQEWVRGFTADTSELQNDGIARCKVTQDGYIAFATALRDSAPSSSSVYRHIAAGKLDLNGDTVWYREFDRSEPNFDVLSFKEFPNGDLLLVGRVDSYLDSTYTLRSRGWMMRLSSQGDSLWEREYTMEGPGAGQTTSYYFYGGRPESDSSILATGFSQFADSGSHQDLWVVKTNCAGFTDYPSADFSFTTDSSKGVSFTNESANAMDYFWSFGDGFHSSLKAPAYTYGDTNSYTVQLIASACGFSDTITRTVQPEEIEDTTSVEHFDEEKVSFQLHPNPNEGRFRVHYELPSSGARMELRDMQGRPVLERRLLSREGSISVDRTELSPGIYLLQLRSEEGRTLGRRKVVVR